MTPILLWPGSQPPPMFPSSTVLCPWPQLLHRSLPWCTRCALLHMPRTQSPLMPSAGRTPCPTCCISGTLLSTSPVPCTSSTASWAAPHPLTEILSECPGWGLLVTFRWRWCCTHPASALTPLLPLLAFLLLCNLLLLPNALHLFLCPLLCLSSLALFVLLLLSRLTFTPLSSAILLASSTSSLSVAEGEGDRSLSDML